MSAQPLAIHGGLSFSVSHLAPTILAGNWHEALDATRRMHKTPRDGSVKARPVLVRHRPAIGSFRSTYAYYEYIRTCGSEEKDFGSVKIRMAVGLTCFIYFNHACIKS